MMKFVVFALIFAIVGAVVALQNATAVTVSFAFWSIETSLVLVILGSAMTGALIILLLAAPVQIRLRWIADKANRRAADLEAKLQAIEGKKPVAASSAAQNANTTGSSAVSANSDNEVGKEMNPNDL